MTFGVNVIYFSVVVFFDINFELVLITERMETKNLTQTKLCTCGNFYTTLMVLDLNAVSFFYL